VKRKKLFKTSCKMKDKVCKVIFYSGRTENLVSTDMVEKLYLEAIAYPTTYKFSWLNKVQELSLTQQCLVNFKIGGYRDEILCDVIPMDVFHVLLGKP